MLKNTNKETGKRRNHKKETGTNFDLTTDSLIKKY